VKLVTTYKGMFINLVIAIFLLSCKKNSIPTPPAPPPNPCIVGGVDTCAIAATTRTATINLKRYTVLGRLIAGD
jgi:hypothetical protein